MSCLEDYIWMFTKSKHQPNFTSPGHSQCSKRCWQQTWKTKA